MIDWNDASAHCRIGCSLIHVSRFGLQTVPVPWMRDFGVIPASTEVEDENDCSRALEACNLRRRISVSAVD